MSNEFLEMKYLFLFTLSLFLLLSCSDSVESEPSDPNPVLGVWNSYHSGTDSLVMTRVFTHDFYSYFSFAEGKLQNQYNKQEYTISDNRIILQRYTQTFEIIQDTLWITNSLGDQVTKYIRTRRYIPEIVE